ncbi:hypothetical protein CYMTET_23608, partial [Cymbomonas tetramitiformis]
MPAQANVEGGCVHAVRATISAVDMTFVGNHASRGGAMFLAEGALVRFDRCIFDSNTGDHGAGVFLYGGNMELRACTFTQNSGKVSGGVHIEGGLAELEECAFHDNACAGEGAAVYVSGGDVTLRGATLERNTADFHGGAVYAAGASTVRIVEATVLRDNRAPKGGAMYVEDFTTVEVEGAVFLRNVADSFSTQADDLCSSMGEGGALAAVDSSVALSTTLLENNNASIQGGGLWVQGELRMHDCVLRDNVAGQNAGGVAISGRNFNLTVSNCSLLHNSVVSQMLGGVVGMGGGLYLELRGNETRVQLVGTSLVGNAASQGGGLYLTGQTKDMELQLREMRFQENEVDTGGCMYWLFAGNETLVPQCEECECEDVASSVVSYQMEQLAAEHGKWRAIQVLEAQSNEMISPSIRYIAKDYYGSVVTVIDDSLSVSATLDSSSGTNENTTNDKYYLLGATVEIYGLSGAVFDGLVAAGTPGKVYQLRFTPDTGDGSFVLPMVLGECRPGEQYNADAQTCTECAPGYLKFDNGTDECVECTSDLIDCLGGSRPAQSLRTQQLAARYLKRASGITQRYYIEQGAWVSPGVALCVTTEARTATECFLNYIYECTTPSMCKSDDAGRKHDGLDVSRLDLCRTGHRNGYVMCGVCEASYQRGINGICQSCSDAGVSFAQ